MGKVLKIVAIVAVAAAVAYFAPQISAALLASTASAATTAAVTAAVAATLSLAATAALTMLAGKPRADTPGPGIFRQAVANSFIVYGKRRVGGLLIFFHPRTVGKDQYRYFVIAVSTSKFVCHGQELMGISTMAPIYQAIEGARAGETVQFNGRDLLVEEVA